VTVIETPPPPGPAVPYELPARPQSSGRSLGWWGMISLIATEGMIFALLLFAYFYLRSNSPRWPQGDIHDPELLKSGIRTAMLLGSSIPMHLGEKAIKKGDRRGMIWLFAIGWLMALFFTVTHFVEWAELLKEFTPSTNAYGSAFYSITGLHIAHVIIGMAAIAFIWVRAVSGHYDEHHHSSVVNAVLYWHFVDAVWVFVYSSLYLSVTWL
jgi:heme/copper-type cytochrome/quinol oxidase subunit 3